MFQIYLPPPGWIHETTGTFHQAFYTLAAFEAVGAFLIIITPSRTSNYENLK